MTWFEIIKGDRCTRATKKTSSTRKGKKWMKCVPNGKGGYKRVHWGQRGVTVSGKRKGKKTQGGWIDCSTCGSKNGPKPCGRKDASKGRKRRCRPTCSACKTYKRRKGSR